MSVGRLVGVGLGPGDPDLVTLEAVSQLRRADRVFVPATGPTERSHAETIVARHVPAERIERLRFAMRDASHVTSRHADAARRIAALLHDGADVAFGTLGDPNLYSTFSALTRAVRDLVPDALIETTPGITALQALAARAGVVLAEGATPVTIIPFLDGGADALCDALDSAATVVIYKATGRLGDARAALAARGRLTDAVYGERIGLYGERIAPAERLDDERAPYLATLIAPAGANTRDDAHRGDQ